MPGHACHSDTLCSLSSVFKSNHLALLNNQYPPKINSFFLTSPSKAAQVSTNKFQAAPILPHLAHPAHATYTALVPRLVHAAVERAHLERAPGVDGRVRRRADVELGELVELDLVRIVGRALAGCFDFAGLWSCISLERGRKRR